jgi:hypothetical protein
VLIEPDALRDQAPKASLTLGIVPSCGLTP